MDIYAAYTYTDFISIVWIALGALAVGGIIAFFRLIKQPKTIDKMLGLTLFYAALCTVAIYAYQAVIIEPNRRKEAEVVHAALQSAVSQKSLLNKDLIITFVTPKGPESVIVPADIAIRAEVNNSWAMPSTIFNNIVLVLGAGFLILGLMFRKK